MTLARTGSASWTRTGLPGQVGTGSARTVVMTTAGELIEGGRAADHNLRQVSAAR